MIERARHLPLSGYICMPWRNGAGTTREIARTPADGEHFAWRLSLATLQASGPFSSYRGYQRCVALVDGHGFRLNIQGSRTETLAARGAHALFAGVAETSCALLDGPCTDLSLIVRDPGTINAVARRVVDASQTMSIAPAAIQVLFVLLGAVECRAPRPFGAAATARAAPYLINVNDTLLINGPADSWSIRPVAGEIAELLMISFSPSDLATAATAPSGVGEATMTVTRQRPF